jgi:hypothetical protein
MTKKLSSGEYVLNGEQGEIKLSERVKRERESKKFLLILNSRVFFTYLLFHGKKFTEDVN